MLHPRAHILQLGIVQLTLQSFDEILFKTLARLKSKRPDFWFVEEINVRLPAEQSIANYRPLLPDKEFGQAVVCNYTVVAVAGVRGRHVQNVACVRDHDEKLYNIVFLIGLESIRVRCNVNRHGVHTSNNALLKVWHLVVLVFKDEVMKLQF